jgi:hypothetical protein
MASLATNQMQAARFVNVDELFMHMLPRVLKKKGQAYARASPSLFAKQISVLLVNMTIQDRARLLGLII